MTFKELIAKFREDHYPTLDLSTRTRYNRLLEKYFGSIESLVVVDTKPQTIDLWLKEVKKVCGEQGAKQRKFYKHELDMLRTLLSCGVKWKRDTKQPTDLGTLKNSEHIGGAKEQPVFPEVYQMLMAVFPDFEARKGLMFTDEDGKLFEYRQIQRAFDRAFEIAGLDFTGTHIMRHGGCRVLLNETGDRYIAQQHLGNSSLKSTDVYAIREAKALTKAVEKRWEVFPGGRKWSQS